MHTFITAADSETLKGFHSPEEATGEPRRGCLSSLASQAEEGFGDRFRELPWTSCQLPIALEFRRPKSVQKEVGSGVPRCGKEGEWLRPLPTGRAHPLAPLPSGCYLCPPGRNLRVGGSGVCIRFPGVPCFTIFTEHPRVLGTPAGAEGKRVRQTCPLYSYCCHKGRLCCYLWVTCLCIFNIRFAESFKSFQYVCIIFSARELKELKTCLLYTSPSPRDLH